MKDDFHAGRKLQDEWERAVERAAQNQPSDHELEPEVWNDAAGLHVRSGVKGGWTGSCWCSETCAPCVS